MEGIAQAQRMAAASLPMERMAEYLVQQMEAGGKQLHHAGCAARCTAYTGEHSVCAQHAAPRSEGMRGDATT